jgi:Rrf2 family transcriptional regulator, iron-sulfur cluster assembly transcription factor
MELSTRGRYAVMAMAELAARGEGTMSLAEIAACQCLSQCYLEQLFAKLRRAGLVVSARGPGGGYRLARPAGEVTIAAIMLAVDEPLHATRCTPGSGGCLTLPGGAAPCRTHALWDALGRQIRSFLDGVTLADVVGERVREPA